MRKSFSLLFIFTLISFVGIKADVPQGITLQKNASGYLVNVALPAYSFENVSEKNDEYLKISVADYGITNEIGLPQLPQASFFLAIPDQEDNVTVQVKSSQSDVVVLQHKVYPFQMPWSKNIPLAERPFSLNRAYYNSKGVSQSVPVTVSEPFYLGGVKGVRVTVYPFSYSPVENKLTVLNSLSFQLQVKGQLQTDRTHSAVFNSYLNGVFANYTSYTSKAAINYLIITAPEFEAGLAPFVTFKQTQGYNVTVVTTAVAGTNTNAIKTFITNRYNDPLQKPEYVLFVGDVDKIPNWTGTGSDSPPTDLNYSLIVGSDMFADIFVGRFPVTTPTELSNLISKSIYMESYIATLAKNNVFMASTDNWDITEATHETVINTYFQPNGYTNQKLYTHTYNATTQQLRDALNANKVFAIYSGHGSTTSWADGPVFSQSDVRALTNTVYPFVYSFACITGSYHMSGECFAETWVRGPKGGSMFYGSSVNSFWDEDDILEKRLIKAMFDDNLAKVTPMMDKAKVYFVQHYGSLTSDVKRYMEMYNCMGDPSLPTKKVIPPDNTPPAAITNLAASEATSSAIKLTWTAPYDSTFGGITSYDIRYSPNALDSTNFNNAAYYALAASDTAGTPKSFVVDSLLAGTNYYLAVKARDIWNNVSPISNVVSFATLAPPVALATPDSINKVLNVQTVVLDSVMIKNNALVPSTLNFSAELVNNTFPGKVNIALLPVKNETQNISGVKTTEPEVNQGQSVKGQGGPDTFGYEWIDSDEPNGPQYVWNDISTTGTLASNWVATGTFDPKDEGYAGPLQLGFGFKFYGAVKNQVYVSSNGVILFTAPTTNVYSNNPIPTASEPNSYIAPFWDDLDGRTQGTVHYQQDGNRFIIQYTNWQKYSATGSLTFQVVMYSSGKVLIYYNNMNATLNGATVGIENGAGNDGLQIAYNATYVKNNLAVKIAAEPDWIAATNVAGMLYTGNSAAIRLTLRSEDYPVGNYRMVVRIKSNDPAHSVIDVPVNMSIVNTQIPVTVLAPNGGENWQVGSQKNITWNSNGITNVALHYSVDNGTTWLPIAATVPAATGSYAWTVPNTPSAQCKVKISNVDDGAVFDVSNATFSIAAAPVSGWQVALTVADNGTMNAAMKFGVSASGTNGIDPALGEVSLPPAPPTGVFDARFELPVTPADYSLIDIRVDTLQSAAWVLRFQPSAQGYPMVFTWNAATLPQGSFTMKDMVTGTVVNVDMKSQSTYTLTNTGITALKIEYTKQLSIPMSMTAGWNMVAMPLMASNMQASVLFPQATSSVFAYNAGYTPVTDVAVGKGYWVRYPAATATVVGSPAGLSTVALNAGWNLIGVYHQTIPVSGLTTTPAGIVNSSFFSFDAGYQPATNLLSCKGYWVRTSQAGVLNLNVTEAKSGNTLVDATPSKEWGKIIVTDATGAERTLYVAGGADKANLDNYALPPVPPTGVYDVRFNSDRSVVILDASSTSVMMQGAQYPVQVRVIGTSLQVADLATGGKVVNQLLNDGDVVSIVNPQITVLGIMQSAVPVAFALEQNYPNPFNPSTNIRFGLPEKSKVTLTIYNQLGEKIAVLLSGEKETGFHTVTWNAASQVSGVYFYELRTEKSVITKKLLLMK